MHKDFGEWYRLAGIEPQGESLANRWAVVEAFSPSRNDVVSLTELFYQFGKADETFLTSFVGGFQTADPAFRMRENNHELSVLAGAQLIHIIGGSNVALADMAALSLVSAAASNTRPGPSVKDIPEIAVRYLARRSSERASSIHADVRAADGRKDLFEALTMLGAPYDALAKEVQQLRHQLGVVTEESNILWWLFSEFSRDEEERWTKFSVPATALMAGKELADLTIVLPGPAAAYAFLDRVIKCAKPKPPATVLISEAINAVSIAWRERYSSRSCPSELEPLLPIGHAVKVSLTAPQDGEWLPAFTQTTGIPADAKIAPHVLAHQVYVESLLCRSWKGLS